MEIDRAPNTKKGIEYLLKLIVNYAAARPEDKELWAQDFRKQIELLDTRSIAEFVSLCARNRITLLLHELAARTIDQNDSISLETLRKILRTHNLQIQHYQMMRDNVLEKLVDVLEENSIDYLFFKTFNKFGEIGVDVDLLIQSTAFDSCVKALLLYGFASIDDLSKRYATGFVMKNNPIIVDLHTDIAVLGVSYFSPEILLHHKRKIYLQIGREQDGIEINCSDEPVGAVVTMAHSIIKEGSVRASDLLEVHQALRENEDPFRQIVESESLQLTSESFARILQRMLVPRAGALNKTMLEKNYLLASFNEAYLERSLQDAKLPLMIPTPVMVMSFLDSLLRRKKLGLAVPKAISSIRYERNLVRAGQKLTSLLAHSL